MPRLARMTICLSICLSAMTLSGCGGAGSSTVRYEVTARMKVGERFVTGSSVREITYTDTPNSLSQFALSTDDRGEGVVIDSGIGGKSIFVLLNDRDGSGEFPWLVTECFKIKLGGERAYIAELNAIPIGQTCEYYDRGKGTSIMPLIVAFRDEREPKSIVALGDPGFDEAVGAKTYFMEFTLRRVDPATPLTVAMDRALPWLKDIPFNGSSFPQLDPGEPGVILPSTTSTLAQKVAKHYFKG